MNKATLTVVTTLGGRREQVSFHEHRPAARKALDTIASRMGLRATDDGHLLGGYHGRQHRRIDGHWRIALS